MIQPEIIRLKISRKNNQYFVFCLLFSVLWMIVIYLFSAQTGDESSSQSGFIADMLCKIIPFELSEDGMDVMTFIIRKLAHFTEYAVLGFLYIMTIIMSDKLVKAKLWVSTLLCFVYAISDEFHQSFVGGRSPAFRDVIIDTAGGLAGSLIGLFVIYIYIKKRGIRDDSKEDGRICGE